MDTISTLEVAATCTTAGGRQQFAPCSTQVEKVFVFLIERTDESITLNFYLVFRTFIIFLPLTLKFFDLIAVRAAAKQLVCF